jgi:cytochrome c-type biogenesis protein CcmE
VTRVDNKNRTRYIVAAVGCGLAIVAVIVLAIVLSNNVVYFRTVSEALKTRTTQGDGRFRLAGAVVPGTVHETRNGVAFSLTDGKNTVRVLHAGDPPELFRAKAPVVCEGHWGTGALVAFDSDRIMIKHGADYEPPKVDTKNAPKVHGAASGSTG